MSGQAYADALGDAALEGAKLPILAALLGKLEAAENFYELKKGVLELYRTEPPPNDVSETLQNLFVLGDLAGRVAVLEDA